MSDQPEKPPHVSQKDWDDAEIPEWTDADFARAVPFQQAHPELFAAWKRGPGRPKVDTPKVHTGFRLAADVVDGIKATGKGYNARVESVLREALASGKLDRTLDPPESARAAREPRRRAKAIR
jgi:uncharacterized protein (DUF4415 family)